MEWKLVLRTPEAPNLRLVVSAPVTLTSKGTGEDDHVKPGQVSRHGDRNPELSTATRCLGGLG